ncbi:PREDICTED: classical arabinogalactan protein 9 [Tarenaya hassleriana]|uniref:classical arabinogalactan protein 9 n=1 Tax=Tarenaya hassleriana TaxID=28532 RepID=UPI00053C9998|nr:PREDICTED: classical arabinogalactan protein 9 [Tarenaya hassleriana]
MSKIIVVALVAMMSAMANGQQPGSQCTPTMMNTVGPCMSFLTSGNGNVSSPSSDCCNSLRSLTTGGMGCLCLIVTGNIPFQIPINRTTAVSLPRSCNMPSVPLQCKANISPAAAPGPASSGPAMSPSPAVVPEPTPAAQPPQTDSTTPVLQPPSPATVDGGAPNSDVGGSSRPSLTPSSSAAFRSSYSPSLLFFVLGLLALKYF